MPHDDKKDKKVHIPLHKRLGLGSEMGLQHDQKMVVAIAQSYLEQIKDGAMTIEAIGEIDLGDGKYIRTFVIQEDKNA